MQINSMIDDTTPSNISSAESARHVRQFWHHTPVKSTTQSRVRMLLKKIMEKYSALTRIAEMDGAA